MKNFFGTVPNNTPDLCDRIKPEQMFNFKDGGIDRCDIRGRIENKKQKST